jgi:hypothetical protein
MVRWWAASGVAADGTTDMLGRLQPELSAAASSIGGHANAMDPRCQIGSESGANSLHGAWRKRETELGQAHVHGSGGLVDHLQALPGCYLSTAG